VSRIAQPKLGGYAGLASFGLLAALTFSRPELAAIASVFALVLVGGLVLAREPHADVRVTLDRERALSGEEVTLLLAFEAEAAVDRLEAHVDLPDGLELADAVSPFALRLPRGARTIELRVACKRWGGYAVGDLYLRTRDPAALFAYERHVPAEALLRVYPWPEELRGLVAPLETQPFVGSQVSRARGEGIEFAELRPFVPGDRVRRINWRATARRGEPYVNEYHPERTTDVVLFLDTFVDVRDRARGTLDAAVTAAATLAAAYLERKDRVGLVAFGGVLNWLVPATGLKQRYRIVDALIGTEVTLSYAWKDVDVIPHRTLPPKALVLALSPLLDERAVAALLDLRARGFDVAVIEVSPVSFAPAGPGASDRMAHRIWRMRREELRGRYLEQGVPVVEWRAGDPLLAVTEEVARFRRRAQSVRA
jgi:uncharacterized protein (DUF58 family)